MPVAPFRSDPRQDHLFLCDFLQYCYQQAIQEGQAKVASLRFSAPLVDPLLALENLGHRENYGFYLENSAHGDAIAAFGTILYHQSTSRNRFRQAHQFIDQWRSRLLMGDSSEDLDVCLHARFFCSFTFFEQSPQPHVPPARVFLPAWQVEKRQQRSWLVANLVISPEVNLDDLANRITHMRQQLWRLAEVEATVEPPLEPILVSAAQTAGFERSVAQAIRQIEAQQLHKIVLAHAYDMALPRSFSVFQSLRALRRRYPNCHSFAFLEGGDRAFIGASPERLLSLFRHRLVTDALAGSAPRGNTLQADLAQAESLLQSPKELAEHRYVVEFLVRQLSNLGLTPNYRSVPQLLKLSNIQHLYTPIRTTVPIDLHPLTLVQALHPTPAVAGAPIQGLEAHIRSHETFDRELYAAPIGWVDAQGNSEFIVGIRSAQIEGQNARLYAGAGIVAGSDPAREVAEVQLKLQALQQALL